jgi:hypothetical protein
VEVKMSNDMRSALSNAVRYWEKMRVVYNIGLLLILGGYFIYNLPQSLEGISFNFFLILLVLAILANVFYSCAYIVDVFLQLTDFAAVWRKRRWILFTIGFVLAAIITRFISMDIFVPS